MTPTAGAALVYSRDHLPLSNKLRKPIVEKMRRERINSSIEKLSLLGREFLKQQSDSRQEKADILEMTLHFLKQQQQQHESHNSPVCSTATSEGYSRCVQEAVSFLSQCEVQTQSQRRLLSHFLTVEPSTRKKSTSVLQLSSPACHTSSKEEPPASSALWRPW